MASLMYVEFGKPIAKWCQVESVTFGMVETPIAGGPTRKAIRSSLAFSKIADLFDRTLFLHCAGGSFFETVWVEFWKGDALYMKYTIKGVLIDSVQTSGHASETRSTTSVSLSYEEASAAYFKD